MSRRLAPGRSERGRCQLCGKSAMLHEVQRGSKCSRIQCSSCAAVYIGEWLAPDERCQCASMVQLEIVGTR